jgi:hypothetical protein
MDQQYHPVLTYSLYYPGKELPERNVERLSGLNRDVVYNLFCRLKMTLSRSSERDNHQPFMEWFILLLPDGHGKRLKQFLFNGTADHFITTPLVVNQILTGLFSEPAGALESKYERLDYISLALLESLLIYNEHHFRNLAIGARQDDHDLLWQIMMMQDLNGANQASFTRTGAMKQAVFLSYLEHLLKERFEEYEGKICAKLGIGKLVEVSLMYVGLQIEQDKRLKTKDPLICIAPQTPPYQLLYNLNLVTDPQSEAAEFSVFNIMMQPFIRLSNGYLSFTGTHDFALITELGWGYFLFKEGTLLPYVPLFSKSTFQSFFGHYVEKFLLGKVFLSLEQKALRVIPSDDKKTPDMTLVLNETDVFVIEIKTSTLHYKDWEQQDLAAFKKYLDTNFISDKKGVIQLHKCLQNLADDPKGVFDLNTPLHKLKIYPIIVYTEPHAGVVAVNDYIINNSPVLAADLSAKFSVVHPVTMIDGDFFIENVKVLRNNKRLLKDAILRYHSGTKQRKKQWKKVNSTFNFSKAMQNFDNYSIAYEGLYQEDQMDIANEIKAIFNQPQKE